MDCESETAYHRRKSRKRYTVTLLAKRYSYLKRCVVYLEHNRRDDRCRRRGQRSNNRSDGGLHFGFDIVIETTVFFLSRMSAEAEDRFQYRIERDWSTGLYIYWRRSSHSGRWRKKKKKKAMPPGSLWSLRGYLPRKEAALWHIPLQLFTSRPLWPRNCSYVCQRTRFGLPARISYTVKHT